MSETTEARTEEAATGSDPKGSAAMGSAKMEPPKTQAASVEQGRRGIAVMPPVDVVEDEGGITLIADLPGVPSERLSVRADGERLVIEGEAVLDVPEGMEAVYAEMQIPRFRRAFTLSRELDASKGEAVLKDGVLKLRIPKAERSQPRRIEVKLG